MHFLSKNLFLLQVFLLNLKQKNKKITQTLLFVYIFHKISTFYITKLFTIAKS